MDEWLEELDECKRRDFYFEIPPQAAGELADDIRKVLARVDALEAEVLGLAMSWTMCQACF
jgi:hypothetical protein